MTPDPSWLEPADAAFAERLAFRETSQPGDIPTVFEYRYLRFVNHLNHSDLYFRDQYIREDATRLQLWCLLHAAGHECRVGPFDNQEV